MDDYESEYTDTGQEANEKTKTMNKKKRVVMKGGITNVAYKNISKKTLLF